MSLPEFLILSFGLWFGLACLAVAAWAMIAARQTPTPDSGDPDDTADDYDDDVQRITTLPPVPPVDGTLPAMWLPPVPQHVWTENDEAAFRWFALGSDA